MKDMLWKIKKETQAFDIAKDNMAFDEEILNKCADDERIERFYIWKQPSITYSFKQQCPTQMQRLDHAIRLTGGGIVFHSPGDIVFSMASNTGDPDYPKKPKEMLGIVATRVAGAIEATGARLDSSPISMPSDIAYCQSYPTPFEIVYDGKKICGLTIRKYKRKWLIQGIIHTQKTSPLFYPYIVENQRITTTLDSSQIQDYLINH